MIPIITSEKQNKLHTTRLCQKDYAQRKFTVVQNFIRQVQFTKAMRSQKNILNTSNENISVTLVKSFNGNYLSLKSKVDIFFREL